MEHFTMQQWIDFVRGAVNQEQSLAMQRHLDRGCSKCRKYVETWKHVHDCAERESSYEPPAAYVRMAKAQFALNHLREIRSREVSYAALVFDSFAQPVAQGVRSASSTGTHARQLVFRRGNSSIDMRIEFQGNRLAIVGQVLDSGRANSGIGDIPVRLLAYKQQTTTSRFGEFQFEVECVENLELPFPRCVLPELRNDKRRKVIFVLIME